MTENPETICEILPLINCAFPAPAFATNGSSGLDLRATEGFTLLAGEYITVSCGIKIALQPGYEGQIRSRSSLAKKGIIIPNSPGTIDSDYRGEVKVILWNLSKDTQSFTRGDRIAQLVISRVERAEQIKIVDRFSEPLTARGEGGFGSTGLA